jgi:PPOX class probable F420-dependent enzyme
MDITLADALELARRESYLAVVSTVRANGSVQSSLVNAGVINHPIDGEPTVAYVTYGPIKVANLRRRSATAVTFRSGWAWCTVEGTAGLIGPDDPFPEVDAERLRLLLREIFVAAGGSHDDWAEYDRVMVRERRTAVLVAPRRIYGSPPARG